MRGADNDTTIHRTLGKPGGFVAGMGDCKVSSLSTYQYIRAEDDTLTTKDLLEDQEVWIHWNTPASTPTAQNHLAELNQLASIMQQKTWVHGSLVIEDLRHTVIVARAEYRKSQYEHHMQLIRDLNTFLGQENFQERGIQLNLLGNALFSEQFITLTQEDRSRLHPLVGVVILFMLLVAFRTWASVPIPLVVIVGALVIAMGLQGALGWPMNTVNTAVPIFLIIVGIGDAVHMLSEFYRLRGQGYDSQQSAIQAV